VPAELQPAVQLAMMMEKHTRAVGIHHQPAAGEVPREGSTLETRRGAAQQGYHPLARGLFFGTVGEIELG